MITKKSKGGGLAINPNHIFADSTARDAYFALHPTELVKGTFISVGTDYEEYDGTTYQSKTSILQGNPGLAGSIQVGTVTTLPAGSSATVVNIGTTNSAIFDFGIPKGADGAGGGSATWGGITGTLSAQTDLNSALSGKQATLVSGTNIKTINGTSVLGSGNIVISGGGGGAVDSVNGQTGTVVLTQDNIADGTTYKQYSEAEKTKLSNITGTNTGDETTSTIKTKLGAGSTSTDGYITSTDWNTFNGKQANLVSGTNIKTINGASVLGSGDIVVSGGAGVIVYADLTALKAVDTTAYTDVQTVQVATLGLYKFQPASTLTGDDVNVVSPTTGSAAGRWIKQSVDITEQATTSWGKVQVATTNNRQIKTTGLTKQKKVVFIGSSVLLGTGASAHANSWAGRLETALQAETDITFVGFENRGITANTPANVRERIINEVCSLNPDIVVIGLCSNNSALHSQSTEAAASITVSAYLEYILQICSILDERGIAYILTGEYGIGSATVYGIRAKKAINFKLSNLFKNRYMACLGNVANEADVSWVTQAGSVDGAHPADAGHKAIFDNIDISLFKEPYTPFFDFLEYNSYCKMGTTTGFQGLYLAPLGTSATSYIQDYTCFVDVNKGTGANSKVLFKSKRSSSIAGIVIKTDANGYIAIYEGPTLKNTTTITLKEKEMTRICISTNTLTSKCKILIDGVAVYSWTLATALNANLYDLKLGGEGNSATENAEGYGFANLVLYRGMLDDYSISKCFQGEWFKSNVIFAHNLNIVNTTETALTSQCGQVGGKIVAYLQESGVFVNQSNKSVKFTDTEKTKLATINTVGSAVASATTITAPSTIFHVTGTTAISTINVPYTGFTGKITIIPDGIFTFDTAGNIAEAYTATVNRAIDLVYDGTKWYRVNN